MSGSRGKKLTPAQQRKLAEEIERKKEADRAKQNEVGKLSREARAARRGGLLPSVDEQKTSVQSKGKGKPVAKVEQKTPVVSRLKSLEVKPPRPPISRQPPQVEPNNANAPRQPLVSQKSKSRADSNVPEKPFVANQSTFQVGVNNANAPKQSELKTPMIRQPIVPERKDVQPQARLEPVSVFDNHDGKDSEDGDEETPFEEPIAIRRPDPPQRNPVEPHGKENVKPNRNIVEKIDNVTRRRREFAERRLVFKQEQAAKAAEAALQSGSSANNLAENPALKAILAACDAKSVATIVRLRKESDVRWNELRKEAAELLEKLIKAKFPGLATPLERDIEKAAQISEQGESLWDKGLGSVVQAERRLESLQKKTEYISAIILEVRASISQPSYDDDEDGKEAPANDLGVQYNLLNLKLYLRQMESELKETHVQMEELTSALYEIQDQNGRTSGIVDKSKRSERRQVNKRQMFQKKNAILINPPENKAEDEKEDDQGYDSAATVILDPQPVDPTESKSRLSKISKLFTNQPTPRKSEARAPTDNDYRTEDEQDEMLYSGDEKEEEEEEEEVKAGDASAVAAVAVPSDGKSSVPPKKENERTVWTRIREYWSKPKVSGDEAKSDAKTSVYQGPLDASKITKSSTRLVTQNATNWTSRYNSSRRTARSFFKWAKPYLPNVQFSLWSGSAEDDKKKFYGNYDDVRGQFLTHENNICSYSDILYDILFYVPQFPSITEDDLERDTEQLYKWCPMPFNYTKHIEYLSILVDGNDRDNTLGFFDVIHYLVAGSNERNRVYCSFDNNGEDDSVNITHVIYLHTVSPDNFYGPKGADGEIDQNQGEKLKGSRIEMHTGDCAIPVYVVLLIQSEGVGNANLFFSEIKPVFSVKGPTIMNIPTGKETFTAFRFDTQLFNALVSPIHIASSNIPVSSTQVDLFRVIYDHVIGVLVYGVGSLFRDMVKSSERVNYKLSPLRYVGIDNFKVKVFVHEPISKSFFYELDVDDGDYDADDHKYGGVDGILLNELIKSLKIQYEKPHINFELERVKAIDWDIAKLEQEPNAIILGELIDFPTGQLAKSFKYSIPYRVDVPIWAIQIFTSRLSNPSHKLWVRENTCFAYALKDVKISNVSMEVYKEISQIKHNDSNVNCYIVITEYDDEDVIRRTYTDKLKISINNLLAPISADGKFSLVIAHTLSFAEMAREVNGVIQEKEEELKKEFDKDQRYKKEDVVVIPKPPIFNGKTSLAILLGYKMLSDKATDKAKLLESIRFNYDISKPDRAAPATIFVVHLTCSSNDVYLEISEGILTQFRVAGVNAVVVPFDPARYSVMGKNTDIGIAHAIVTDEVYSEKRLEPLSGHSVFLVRNDTITAHVDRDRLPLSIYDRWKTIYGITILNPNNGVFVDVPNFGYRGTHRVSSIVASLIRLNPLGALLKEEELDVKPSQIDVVSTDDMYHTVPDFRYLEKFLQTDVITKTNVPIRMFHPSTFSNFSKRIMNVNRSDSTYDGILLIFVVHEDDVIRYRIIAEQICSYAHEHCTFPVIVTKYIDGEKDILDRFKDKLIHVSLIDCVKFKTKENWMPKDVPFKGQNAYILYHSNPMIQLDGPYIGSAMQEEEKTDGQKRGYKTMHRHDNLNFRKIDRDSRFVFPFINTGPIRDGAASLKDLGEIFPNEIQLLNYRWSEGEFV
jgi:hypothetical protein